MLPHKALGPITGSTGAAVVFTVLAQRPLSREFELCTELLSWIFLPLLFAVEKSFNISSQPRTSLSHNSGSQRLSATALWIVATCLTIACCFRAEIGVIGLFPALTPLLMIIQEHVGSPLQSWKSLGSYSFFVLVSKPWTTALVACIAIVTSPDWDLLGMALAIIPAAMLLLVYVTLIPKAQNSRFVLFLDLEEAITPFSVRVAILLSIALAVQVFMFGMPSKSIIHILSYGLTKALSWYFLAKTARHTSWCIATAIITFSIVSTRDQSMQSSEAQALSQIFASFLCLGQVILMLPKQAKARYMMWCLLLIPIVSYLTNGMEIRNLLASAPFKDQLQVHPVEVLVRKAKGDFEGMLQRQSQTYNAAAEEYQRRYKLEPPPGFKAWYNFATATKSPIIDEFDAIFNMISPFLKLSGKEVLKAMADVQNVPDIDVWVCAFSTDEAATHCSHPLRSFDRNLEALFNTLLGNLGGRVPDVTFLVNHLDEPRVLLSPPVLLQERNNYDNGKFVVSVLSRQPTWDAVTKFCKSGKIGAGSATENSVDTFGLPIVTDNSSTMDPCQHPEYSKMHGLFMRPTSFGLVEGLVPILSTGSLSTMGDILFPSPAYLDPAFQYNKDHDLDWDKKKNGLYWAGSTTGGFASDDSWGNFHRQRFVKLAQNLDKKNYYLREKNGVIAPEKSTFLNGRLFDVAFTRIFQCERKFCRDQRNHFKSKSWADKDRALQSRLVFDLDGNGISGRYYKMLASNSAPLKQTIFREWHDDRLIPWFHYIPVSLSLGELPELVFYLTSTEAGQQRAKEIAEQGQDWFSKAFREVDLSVYTYRLLLELARLQDPDRLAS